MIPIIPPHIIRTDPAPDPAPDPVNHPSHYNTLPTVCSECGHPIETIDVVRHLDFDLGNAIKYLWRAGLKGDAVQDLEKAIWYIQDEIDLIKRKSKQ